MIVSFIFIFLIVWWVVIFAVLPFGVEREENPEKGNDSGAPKQTHLLIKIVVTTIISLIITAAIMYGLENGLKEYWLRHGY